MYTRNVNRKSGQQILYLLEKVRTVFALKLQEDFT